MRMLRLALALIFFAHAAFAAQEVERRRLSLEQCIEIALEHNFDIQVLRYSPEISLYNLRGSYAAYDPVFTSAIEHGYDLSPGGIDEQNRPFGGTETERDSISAALTGTLPWGMGYRLGGNASDRYGKDPVAGTNLVTLFETTSGEAGAFSLTQPLLKGFWTDPFRYDIFFSKRELQISELDFRDRVMAVITEVERAYFQLIADEESIKVQQKALELAERTLSENQKRVEVGSMSPLDQKQAESQVATSRANLISAFATAGTQQRVLKRLLSDDYTNQWGSKVLIEPTDKMIALPQQFDLQESWRKGLAHGGSLYTLQQVRLRLEQAKGLVGLRRNDLFPQLDVTGSYGFSGTGKEFSGALDQVSRRNSPFWTVGAQVSIPLSQTSARNSFKSAKAQREVRVLELRAAEQNTLIQIENDIGTARSSFESVHATREATIYSEAALEAEQTKFENGKSTLFNVLDLQSKLTAARSAEIQSLANYNISLANLAYDEGSTLERRRINFKDVRER